MSYHTGTAADWAALARAIEDVLLAKGWQQHPQGIFERDGCFVRLAAFNRSCVVEVATGANAQGLTGKYEPNSRAGAWLGYEGTSRAELTPVLPLVWHIWAFNAPLEVYVVIQWGDKFSAAAFGQSAIIAQAARARGLSAEQASGNWFMASGLQDVRWQSGGGTWSNWLVESSIPAPFGRQGGYQVNRFGIHTGLNETYNGQKWEGAGGGWFGMSAPYGVLGEISNSHLYYGNIEKINAWNAAAPMWPISLVQTRPESRASQVLELRNARMMRIDHYEPLEHITIGHETWCVLPWLKKEPRWPLGEASNANGANPGGHSGCMGWAILHTSTDAEP